MSVNTRRARHSGRFREAEPLERHLLVGADRREILGPLDDANRVGTADTHAAPDLDWQTALLDVLEQRGPGLDGDAPIARHDRQIGEAVRGCALERSLSGGSD